MAGRIFGTVKNQIGLPVGDLRVEAWDDDFSGGDDFMGAALTNEKGEYVIACSEGHWDLSISERVSVWRPDIYIKIRGKNSAGMWVDLIRSGTHPNHKLEDDLQIDLFVIIESNVSKHTAFDPMLHGFGFNNSFTAEPNILGINLGKWYMGFCGGMCAAVLNRFNKGLPLPSGTSVPGQGSELYKELLARQVASLLTPKNLLDDIYLWQTAPDEQTFFRKKSIGWKTGQEWWKLKKRIDNGKPAILILIRVAGYLGNPSINHQVVATGYEFNPTTKDLIILTYDPNRPGEVNTLKMNVGLPNNRLFGEDSSGALFRGFFVNPNTDYSCK